jgi:iron complex outermembrane receptor protein
MKLYKKPVAVAVALASATCVQTTLAQESALALEEVVVTATRRSQSLIEVPYNISALSAEELAKAGVTNLSGVMNSVAGIVFSDQGPRGNAVNNGIVMRGLNIRAQATNGIFSNLAVPTVSTYIDNTPAFFNLQLVDLNRVEVLRGPQGTLYGSGSLAGTVRFIHNKPTTEAIEGYVSGGTEWLGESSDETYQVEGAINIPLGENSALRIAGAYEDRGGVIDYTSIYQRQGGKTVLQDPNDILRSPAATEVIKDGDTAKSYSLRASLLWEPTDNLSAQLNLHHQNVDADGENYRELESETYESFDASRSTFEQEVDLVSLEVEADLGFATLTSSTAYTKSEIDTVRDLGYLPTYLDSVPLYYLFGVGSATRPGCGFYGCYPRANLFPAREPQDRDDFTQEFRLASNGDNNKIDWLVGAYYNDQETDLISDEEIPGYAEWASLDGSADGPISAFYDADINLPPGYNFANSWLNPLLYALTPQPGIPQLYIARQSEFKDMAVYGEVTFNITDNWQVTGGARYFDQEYEIALQQIFTNCGAACTTADQAFMDQLGAELGYDLNALWGVSGSDNQQDESDLIFKLNTSYQFGEQNLYFTWAEGFRHGGANALPVGFDIITQELISYDADETQNWELGLKGYLMDGQLQYSATGFYTQWDKSQIEAFVSIAALPAVINAAESESKGLELSLTGNLTERLSFFVGYVYTDAELTEGFSAAAGTVNGIAGSPLPNISKHMANFSVDYQIPALIGGFDLLLHGDGRYRSDARNDLTGGFNDYQLDSFSIWNASINLVGEEWTLSAFANNLTDETQAVTTVAVQAGTNYEAAERPRSLGIRVRYEF